MPILAQATDAGLVSACGESRQSLTCRWVYEWTGSEAWASTLGWALGRPIRAVIVLLVAWLVARFVKRAVVRFTKRIASAPSTSRLKALRELGPGGMLIDDTEASRAESRAETLGHVLRSVLVVLIWTLAGLVILGEVGVNLAPLIAGAGIGGVALGFGAQSIVKDFLSGLFMLIEDHYGVGDVVDVGYAVGTVEKVSLRSTALRDVKGTVWHVPNGEISRIGNFSQLWSRALIDIEVSYDSDLRSAMAVLDRVAGEFWDDPEWGNDELSERPEVWGVQALNSSGIALRIAVKTEPSMQWGVERELRLRIKEAFDAAGLEIPFPHRTVHIRSKDVPVDAVLKASSSETPEKAAAVLASEPVTQTAAQAQALAEQDKTAPRAKPHKGHEGED